MKYNIVATRDNKAEHYIKLWKNTFEYTKIGGEWFQILKNVGYQSVPLQSLTKEEFKKTFGFILKKGQKAYIEINSKISSKKEG